MASSWPRCTPKDNASPPALQGRITSRLACTQTLPPDDLLDRERRTRAPRYASVPEPLGGCIGWLGCGPTGGSSGGRREVGQAKADHDHPSEKQGDEQTLRVAAKAKSKERDYSKKKRPDDTGGKRQRRN